MRCIAQVMANGTSVILLCLISAFYADAFSFPFSRSAEEEPSSLNDIGENDLQPERMDQDYSQKRSIVFSEPVDNKEEVENNQDEDPEEENAFTIWDVLKFKNRDENDSKGEYLKDGVNIQNETNGQIDGYNNPGPKRKLDRNSEPNLHGPLPSDEISQNTEQQINVSSENNNQTITINSTNDGSALVNADPYYNPGITQTRNTSQADASSTVDVLPADPGSNVSSTVEGVAVEGAESIDNSAGFEKNSSVISDQFEENPPVKDIYVEGPGSNSVPGNNTLPGSPEGESVVNANSSAENNQSSELVIATNSLIPDQLSQNASAVNVESESFGNSSPNSAGNQVPVVYPESVVRTNGSQQESDVVQIDLPNLDQDGSVGNQEQVYPRGDAPTQEQKTNSSQAEADVPIGSNNGSSKQLERELEGLTKIQSQNTTLYGTGNMGLNKSESIGVGQSDVIPEVFGDNVEPVYRNDSENYINVSLNGTSSGNVSLEGYKNNRKSPFNITSLDISGNADSQLTDNDLQTNTTAIDSNCSVNSTANANVEIGGESSKNENNGDSVKQSVNAPVILERRKRDSHNEVEEFYTNDIDSMFNNLIN